jgi:predicted ATPase/DNA-binding SARP family transcriptional activator
MRIGLLGPLRLTADDGRPVDLPGARLRRLLALLALTPGEPVPADRLIEAIWPDRSVRDAPHALQMLVSRLRRTVPVAPADGGYLLDLRPDTVDAIRFAHLVEAARDTEPFEARKLLREALALWRGDPPPELTDDGADFVGPLIAGWEALRVAALAARFEADLALGDADKSTSEAFSLVRLRPLDERLRSILMRLLEASGRPVDALAVFEEGRRALADELGVDPSPELRRLHLRILRGPVEEPALPPALTSFVGREADLAAVTDLLSNHRLVTLVGPGGAGKTRLALELGRRGPAGTTGPEQPTPAGTAQREQPPAAGPGQATAAGPGQPLGGGVVRLAELAEARDAAAAWQAVAKALIGGTESKGMLDGPPRPGGELDRIADALAGRKVLLILDNCEHLVGAAAELVGALLARCPGLRVLATSREPLGIGGEALWSVGPLDVDGPAEQLFVDRARTARPRFDAEPARAAIARICRTLDGLPLAIELAAARLRAMSADEIADRLDDRFALLTNGGRTAPARQQTLRATVEWSWDLLTPVERRLARHLAVHAGITLDAAILLSDALPAGTTDALPTGTTDPLTTGTADALPTGTAGAPTNGTTDALTTAAAGAFTAGVAEAGPSGLDLVTGLVDRSILVAEEHDGGTRLRMLATIRAYALDGAPDEDAAREWHARHYLELGERASPHLWTRDQLGWLRRLAAEHDNFEAALRWAVDTGRGDLAVRLIAVAAAGPELGNPSLGAFPVVARAFDLPGARDVPRGTRAQALMIAALVGLGAGSGLPTVAGWFGEAVGLVREAEALGEPMGPTVAGIEALSMLMLGGAPEDVLAHLEGLEAHPVPWVRACGHLMRAQFLASQGAAEDAHGQLTVAVAQLRPLGERWALSMGLQGLAEAASARGDTATALAHLEELLLLVRELGDLPRQASTLVTLAEERFRAGQPDEAEADLAAGEALARRIGARETLARRYTIKGELSEALAELELAPRGAAHRASVLCARGRLKLVAGDLVGARRDRDEAYPLVVEPNDGRALAWVAVFAAEVALAEGDPDGARLLLGAGDTLRGGGDVRQPLATAPRTTVPTRAQALDVLRSAVGTPRPPAAPPPG